MCVNGVHSSKVTSSFADFMERIEHKIRPYLIFTALNTVCRSLHTNALSILDVGCGKGEPMKFINRNKSFYAVGLDVFKPYLRDCKKRGIHNDYILCDVKRLPLSERSFDVVLCTEVLEHLERRHGEELLQFMEKTARKQVIIATPVGEYKQLAYDGNPYQEHRWVWSPTEINRFGYEVRGVGVRGLGGEEGLFF